MVGGKEGHSQWFGVKNGMLSGWGQTRACSVVGGKEVHVLWLGLGKGMLPGEMFCHIKSSLLRQLNFRGNHTTVLPENVANAGH